MIVYRTLKKDAIQMTVNDIVKQQGMSKYSLSKKSGIPWAKLSDICSGKTSIPKCSVATLKKLAIGLKMSFKEVSNLEDGKIGTDTNDKPQEKTYLNITCPHI